MTISEINLPLAPVKSIKKEKADLNGDSRVDTRDLSILLYHWTSSMFYTEYSTKSDLNRDGKVDLGDVALLLANWTN